MNAPALNSVLRLGKASPSARRSRVFRIHRYRYPKSYFKRNNRIVPVTCLRRIKRVFYDALVFLCCGTQFLRRIDAYLRCQPVLRGWIK
jgi:hypothetical protein